MAQALGPVEDYPHYMLSLSVIPDQALEAGANRLRGGRYVMRSLRPAVH